MPKRVVDGEGVWGSDKILRLREDFRPEYANLIPLAEANGVFEVNPHKVWARVYAYNRRDKSLEWVQELLNDLVRVGLLLIWENKGKLWGYWEGNEKSGRLPGEAERKKYKNLPSRPPDNILIVSEETYSRLGEISTELPKSLQESPRISESLQESLSCTGLVSIGMVSTGLDPAGPDSDNSENPLNGQDKEMNLKNFKTQMVSTGAKHSVKVSGYDNTWDELKTLCVAHGYQTVINDFDDYLSENEGDEFPKGALSKYQYVAADRLIGNSPMSVKSAAKSPEVNALTDELTYQSDNVIGFTDPAKARLLLVQEKYTDEEIISVFKEWFAALDTSNPKNVSFGGKNFAEIASQHCYTLRRKREEKVSEGLARQRAVERLQEAANAERLEAEKKRQEEQDAFDPLADLLA